MDDIRVKKNVGKNPDNPIFGFFSRNWNIFLKPGD